MRASVATFLMWHLRLCSTEPQCASSIGSCGTQQSSLMQLKALGQRRAQMQAESTAGTGARLAAYQKFADEMIALDEKDNLNITEPVLDAVTKIHEFIDLLFTDVLLPSHRQDERTITTCAGLVETCNTSHLTTPAGVKKWETEGWAAGNASEKHLACRTEFATQCGLAQGGCEEYNYYRTMKDTVDGDDSCTCTTRETRKHRLPQYRPSCSLTDFEDDYRKAKADTADLLRMEDCLVEMYEWLKGEHDWYQTVVDEEWGGAGNADNFWGSDNGLFGKYSACKANQCDELEPLCRTNQSNFESDQCFLATTKADSCNNFYRCLTCETGDCHTKCGQIADNWQGRAADNETAMRLTCLLDVLFGKRDPSVTDGTAYLPRGNATTRRDDLENCKNADYTSVNEFWKLECSAFPNPPACPVGGQVETPCSTEFQNLYVTPGGLAGLAPGGISNIAKGVGKYYDECTVCAEDVPSIETTGYACTT